MVRSRVPFYDQDRYFAPDIAAIEGLLREEGLRRFLPPGLLPSG